MFELVQELKRELVFGGKSLFTNDCFHGCCVSADGIFGVELVGDVAVVFAGMAFADGGFHEAGEGREDVDGWVDTFVVELTINEDLALSDVTCKIGDGMGDICKRKSACSE